MKFSTIVAAVFTAVACVDCRVTPETNNQVLLQFDTGLKDYIVDDKYSLLQLHKSLVDISSVSFNETEVAKYLEQYLTDAGLTVELQLVEEPAYNLKNKRYNVYAYLGDRRDTKVVMTSHIDTVPPFFPYRVEGSKIYGRGTNDAKGSVATQVITFLDLVSKKMINEGDVSLLFVVGEEVNGGGMKYASDHLNANWSIGIFGEPTELKLGVGHKGIYIFELFAEGKAAHSGYPQLGVSATEFLVPLLNDILQLQLPHSTLLGPSTINIGRIEAGVAANVIPAKGFAQVSIRVATDYDKVVESVKELVKDRQHITFKEYQGVRPQYLDYKVPGFDSIILAYSTDVPNLTLPLSHRFLYGPGSIFVAHGDHEYVENQDLLDAIDGYTRLIDHALHLD
ncbi:uncharacterized protein KQ657_000260 [Scheffersomyces spartinae]|uniref:Peptidase M20 dimerisation domain-containing protein n=1 Tax=Scheffersomyces spartinae TaxID=45513 RepID=A0A9P8AKS1_9ASCO|nr:uncharacterized protein KQ657_000260 [Scheffersomyces spartinae]KAG7196247.1 hypothetical protein KQ657_000260 [Scheffersomyces spartinae]